MFKQIISFRDVKMCQNALIVFDIDDTVLGYKEFSHDYFHNQLKYHKRNTSCENTIMNNAVNDWFNLVKQSTPHHMDEEGFFDLMNKINDNNSNHIFLTARNPKFKDITENHLNKIKINHKNIYYVAGGNKGEILKNIIKDHPEYNKIIFIDDMRKNLIDVYKTFGHKIDLYHFVKKYYL
jgi:uncharacterized HAD superfamily protein